MHFRGTVASDEVVAVDEGGYLLASLGLGGEVPAGEQLELQCRVPALRSGVAFLQFNAEFQIVLFNSYVEHLYREWSASNMPRFLSSTGRCIWLQRRPDSAGLGLTVPNR